MPSDDKVKRQKRAVKRNTVSSKTVGTVCGDTWLLVCTNLYFSPSCVLKLMRTSKTIWIALKENPLWWKTFFDRVLLFQTMLDSSRFISALKEFGKKTENKRMVIYLVFSNECCGCGARYGHSIFKPLMKRLCKTCIHDQLISNRVLLYKYGLHFSDFVLEYCDMGGILMFHSHPKPSITSFLRVTCESLDLVQKTSTSTANAKSPSTATPKMLFFDKTFLRRVLGLNLEEHFRETKLKKEAIHILFACFRRLRTHDLVFSSSKHLLLGVEAARTHEVNRMIHPLKLCTVWLAGGPYYSFPTNLSSTSIDRQQGVAIRRRKGMTGGKIRLIEQYVDEKGVEIE